MGRGRRPVARWWVVVRDDSGAAVSAAMRTAPFKPHPIFSLPMADEAARALAAALHARGEVLGGANGALPGAEVLAGRRPADRGRAVADKATRLWEATEVTVPPGAGGPAAPGDRGRRGARAVVVRGLPRRGRRAGRARPDPGLRRAQHPRRVLVRIREGVEWLWELPDGEVVAPDRRRPAVVRRRADRAGLHAPGAPRARHRVVRRRRAHPPRARGRATGCACSPTRPTRPPTRSTPASATEPVVDMAEHLVRAAARSRGGALDSAAT